MQPRSPELVISIGDPQVSQTRAPLLVAGITIRSLCGHRLAQMAQFFIDVARIGHRAADLFP